MSLTAHQLGRKEAFVWGSTLMMVAVLFTVSNVLSLLLPHIQNRCFLVRSLFWQLGLDRGTWHSTCLAPILRHKGGGGVGRRRDGPSFFLNQLRGSIETSFSGLHAGCSQDQ